MSRYALPLDGYDRASVWGFDEQGITYFAQLWQNSSDSSDDPDLWLSGMNPIGTPERLARLIAAGTGKGIAAVALAMASAQTAPEAERLLDLADTAIAG